MAGKRSKGKKKNRVEFVLVTFALLVLIGVTSVGTAGLRNKQKRYDQREAELTAQIEAEEKRTEEIEELENYMETQKFVEEMAKERLGLVYEDEILFKAKK